MARVRRHSRSSTPQHVSRLSSCAPILPLPPCRQFSAEARDLVKRLLTPDRTRRLGCLFGAARDIKEHPWFAKMSWDAVFNCAIPAPFVPKVRDANDTSNFDDYPDSDGDTAGRLGAKDAELFADLDAF